MFDLSIPKLLVLAVIALVIFGPNELPKIAAQAGRALRDLRKVAEGAKNDLRDGLGPEFANFDIDRILTSGGPIDQTHIFATWAFKLGIEGNDIPLGACVSLFMFPILGVAAWFILRDISDRGNEG